MATLAQLFEQGYQMGQNQAQQQRATTAAEATYGARADNPQLFGQLQNQDIQYNQDQRAQALLPGQIERNNASIAATRTRTAATQQGMDTASGTTLPQMKLSAVNTMLAARDNGGDVGKAFDSTIGANPKAFGIDPANVPAMRAEVLKDPTMLDQIKSGLTSTPGMTTYEKPSTTSSKAAAKAEEAAKGQQDVTSLINEAKGYVNTLKDSGAMSYASPNNTMVGNAYRHMTTGALGQTIRGAFDPTVARARQNLTGLRSQLFNAYRAATGMPAAELRSQKEFMANLEAVVDPTNTYETAMDKLNRFEQLYGLSSNTAKPTPGGQGSKLPAGVTPDRAYSDAKAALAQQADPATIRQRLLDMGLDPAQVGL